MIGKHPEVEESGGYWIHSVCGAVLRSTFRVAGYDGMRYDVWRCPECDVELPKRDEQEWSVDITEPGAAEQAREKMEQAQEGDS